MIKDSDLIKVDYAFIEDRIFAQLSQQEKDMILAHEVYYLMGKEREKESFIILDEYVHLTEPKTTEVEDRPKKRKDFWNELPKPKRRKR